MKKFLQFLDFLWENEILTALAYLITFGWFWYVADVIINSDGILIGKIFFFVWAIVLAFIWLCYKCNNEK